MRPVETLATACKHVWAKVVWQRKLPEMLVIINRVYASICHQSSAQRACARKHVKHRDEPHIHKSLNEKRTTTGKAKSKERSEDRGAIQDKSQCC